MVARGGGRACGADSICGIVSWSGVKIKGVTVFCVPFVLSVQADRPRRHGVSWGLH